MIDTLYIKCVVITGMWYNKRGKNELAVTGTHVQSEALPTPISLENLSGLHLASSSNKESYTHLTRRAMKTKPILLSDVLVSMSGI